jgi:hypothetical protein
VAIIVDDFGARSGVMREEPIRGTLIQSGAVIQATGPWLRVSAAGSRTVISSSTNVPTWYQSTDPPRIVAARQATKTKTAFKSNLRKWGNAAPRGGDAELTAV